MKNTLLILLTFLIIFFLSCQNEPKNIETTPVVDITDGEKTDFSQKDYIVYGDNRTNFDIHTDIVNLMLKHKPKMVFNTGDLVEFGFDHEWELFNIIINPLLSTATYYPAIGNHDMNNIDAYLDNFNLPNNEKWYLIETDKINFIILDNYESLAIGSEQYNWLELTLQTIDNATKFTIVIFHHPPYCVGLHPPKLSLRDSIIPLFEKYNVEIVFNGHDHNYEKFYVNGIYYIVTGGGGGPLYDQEHEDPNLLKFVKVYHYCTLSVEGNELQIEVIDIFSTIIDKITVINK
jgi:3',5'-cyclic AMP phosphodiesterase CpdA